MTESTGTLLERSEKLRAAFDHGFAAAPPAEPPPHVDLLAIRCAEHGFFLQLSQVLSVYTERKIVAMPSPAPDLLGLVGVRGVVAPVYDLRALLGYSASTAPRWLALVRAPAPFAIAFETFERHLRLPRGDVLVATGDGAAAPHPFARGSAKTASGPRPLIDLAALFQAVTGRHKTAPEREDLG